MASTHGDECNLDYREPKLRIGGWRMFRASQSILLLPHLVVGPHVNVPSPLNRLYQDFYAKVPSSRFMYLDNLFHHIAMSCCMCGYLQAP
jgi:hypothetical protein